MLISLNSLYLIAWLILCQVLSCSSSSDFLAKQSYLIRTGFTNIVWDYIESDSFQRLNISSPCLSSLSHVNKSMNQGLKWSLKLLDASGRAPVDFTGLGFVALGNYDECLKLDWTNSNGLNEVGKYCLTSLRPDSEIETRANIYTSDKMFHPELGFSFKIGFCMPSDCSNDDLNMILSRALQSYSWDLVNVENCQVRSTFVEKLKVASVKQKIALICITILIFTVLYSTYLDYKSKYSNDTGQISWFKNFSMITSYKQMVEPNWTSDRAIELSQFAIILHSIVLFFHLIVWTFMTKTFTLFAGASSWMRYKDSQIAPLLFNEWLHEGIFVYGGMARTLELWRSTGPKTPLSRLIINTLIKLISLSILITITMFIHINLRLFISGPFNIMNHDTRACEQSFWKVILLHPHWIDEIEKGCLLHFWSVFVECHMLILIVILVYLYKRYPKIALYLNITVLIGSLLNIGLRYYQYKYPIHCINEGSCNLRTLKKYLETTYAVAWMHLWTYASTVLWTYLMMNKLESIIYKVRFLRIVNNHLNVFGALISVGSVSYLVFSRFSGKQMSDAVFVVLYRILMFIFYTCVALRQADKGRKYFSHRNEKDENNMTEANNETNNNLSVKTKPTFSISPRKIKFYHITSMILRSTYCLHVTIISLTIDYLRHPILTFNEWIIFMSMQICFCLLGGIVFHLFVIGPMSNIAASFKNVNSKKNLKKL